MIKRLIGLLLLVWIVSACSSAPVVPVLSGKKREPINTVIYDKAPLVVVQSRAEQYIDAKVPTPIKNPLPIVTNKVATAKPQKQSAKVIIDSVVEVSDVVEAKKEIEQGGSLNKTGESKDLDNVVNDKTALEKTSSEQIEKEKVEGSNLVDSEKSSGRGLAIPVHNNGAVIESEPVKVRAVNVDTQDSATGKGGVEEDAKNSTNIKED